MRGGGELAGSGQRRVAGIGLVEPGLRRGAIGRRQRLQFAPASAKSLRCAAAVIRADHVAPRSLPTASVRSIRTEFGGAGLQPVDDAGSRGIQRRRRRSASAPAPAVRGSAPSALGTPVAAKPRAASAHRGFGASGLAQRQQRGDRDRRCEPRHRAAAAATTRRSGTSSVDLASCVISALCAERRARAWRCCSLIGGQIGRRAAAAAAAFSVVDRAAPASRDCTSDRCDGRPRSAASDFSSASLARQPPDRARRSGLPTLDSTLATTRGEIVDGGGH